MKRKVCFITGTRAEWGLLSEPVRRLSFSNKYSGKVQVQVIATNMHLAPKYGNTIEEIRRNGIDVDECVPMNVHTTTQEDILKSMSQCMSGMTDALSRLNPDVVVILGDRYEMLTSATVAMMLRIPIIHLCGGEITEGAVDDSIRHAITKMASLHLTQTEAYRQRVIQMGEEPDRVFNVGAIGVENVVKGTLLPIEIVEEFVGMKIDKNTMIVTLHPATLDDVPVAQRCQAMLDALDCFPENNIIITYPNNDAEGRIIIDMITDYARRNVGRVALIPSLGRHRYITALYNAGVVVGNSSSGMIEVPSTGIPTVNIGIRQRGRIASQSVINCDADKDSIVKAISFALSDEGRKIAKEAENPYYKSNTIELVANLIAETPMELLKTKHFYDIKADE